MIESAHAIMSPTQFAWATLGYPPFTPAAARDRCDRAQCYVCGGAATPGWRRAAVIGALFTNQPLAQAPASDAVCCPCAALMGKESWPAHAERYGLKPRASWRSYSHLFAAGDYRALTRTAIRAALLAPPAPPFLIVATSSGQKHLIFRAEIAYFSEVFPVQFEESRVIVDRAVIIAMLATIEAVAALGFGKAQILTGRYSQAQLWTARSGPIRQLERALARYRSIAPKRFALAVFCARGKDAPEPDGKDGIV